MPDRPHASSRTGPSGTPNCSTSPSQDMGANTASVGSAHSYFAFQRMRSGWSASRADGDGLMVYRRPIQHRSS
ncbi:Uncharacterised protein [Mycobacterium tuberculosis]|nr:Uncharacterised protein [Mycobacterium tuberculosis]